VHKTPTSAESKRSNWLATLPTFLIFERLIPGTLTNNISLFKLYICI